MVSVLVKRVNDAEIFRISSIPFLLYDYAVNRSARFTFLRTTYTNMRAICVLNAYEPVCLDVKFIIIIAKNWIATYNNFLQFSETVESFKFDYKYEYR